MKQLPSVSTLPAEAVLSALSFAEGFGFTAELWSSAVNAISESDISPQELLRFARSAGANFIIETSGEDSHPVFRISHQAFNDYLTESRGQIATRAEDESRLTSAFLAMGDSVGWENAPPYLLNSLPVHAQRAGMIDALLANSNWLCHANLRQLRPFIHLASSPEAKSVAEFLRQTPEAVDAPPTVRATMFANAEIGRDLGSSLPSSSGHIPSWAARILPDGHVGSVIAVCAFALDGQTLLATTSDDETVRIWDPTTGHQHRTLDGHTAAVNAVCAFALDGQTLLATTSDDETVRIWDPTTGHQHHTLKGHTSAVNAVCAFTLQGRTLLATTSDDRTIHVWIHHATG